METRKTIGDLPNDMWRQQGQCQGAGHPELTVLQQFDVGEHKQSQKQESVIFAVDHQGHEQTHEQGVLPGFVGQIALVEQQEKGREQDEARIGCGDEAVYVEHHDGESDDEEEQYAFRIKDPGS